MSEWCTTCCTQHPSNARCPGELLSAEPEQRGWQVTVETPRGIQGYGVLLAPIGQRWRARVLTFPNVLWTTPGGRGTLKFLGRSREEAERQAIAFVRQHCAGRGYTLRDELELADAPMAALTAGARPPGTGPRIVSPRFARVLPIRFGNQTPSVLGETGNLSDSGLFVNTDQPLPPGLNAGLLLELEHCKLPLRGSVVWSRQVPAPTRPPGMGLRLHHAPETYLRYVQALSVQPPAA